MTPTQLEAWPSSGEDCQRGGNNNTGGKINCPHSCSLDLPSVTVTDSWTPAVSTVTPTNRGSALGRRCTLTLGHSGSVPAGRRLVAGGWCVALGVAEPLFLLYPDPPHAFQTSSLPCCLMWNLLLCGGSSPTGHFRTGQGVGDLSRRALLITSGQRGGGGAMPARQAQKGVFCLRVLSPRLQHFTTQNIRPLNYSACYSTVQAASAIYN